MKPYEWGSKGSQILDCLVCGKYRITESVARNILSNGLPSRHLYSGAIREQNERGLTVFIDNLDSLLESVVVPQDPLERIDRILLYVLMKMETDDATVPLNEDFDYSVAYAKRPSEFRFLRRKAMDLGYLEAPRHALPMECRLTIDGWKHITSLKQNEVRTNQAFVAMSFDSTLRSVYDAGIKPALPETGYLPLRVDEAHYNEKIDDRIIADIRKSGLVIADFRNIKLAFTSKLGLR